MFENRKSVSSWLKLKMDAYVYQQGRSIGKCFASIRKNELWESKPDGNSQSLRSVKSRTGLLLPVQAGLVRSGRGQIYIPHPTVRKQVPVHGKFVLGIYRPVCNWGGKYHEQPCKPARWREQSLWVQLQFLLLPLADAGTVILSQCRKEDSLHIWTELSVMEVCHPKSKRKGRNPTGCKCGRNRFGVLASLFRFFFWTVILSRGEHKATGTKTTFHLLFVESLKPGFQCKPTTAYHSCKQF